MNTQETITTARKDGQTLENAKQEEDDEYMQAQVIARLVEAYTFHRSLFPERYQQ